MDSNYIIYSLDTETTGIDPQVHDIIEISFIRSNPLSNDHEQKTWFIRPFNENSIDQGALKINGYKYEDITHKTQFGRDTFLDPNKVIIDIENWIAEDNMPSEQRVLLGQNINFDKNMIEAFWKKCNSKDSFPFGRKALDTMMIEFFLDLCKQKLSDSYSLSGLSKKYGIKNEKAHSAAADTLTTKKVFDSQVEQFKKLMK